MHDQPLAGAQETQDQLQDRQEQTGPGKENREKENDENKGAENMGYPEVIDVPMSDDEQVVLEENRSPQKVAKAALISSPLKLHLLVFPV